MAENKNGVLVYADWIDKFEALEDDEAGRLIKHFFRYINDLNPEFPDKITKVSFLDIQNTLKRDLVKWEERAERSRLNGLKGGRPPLNTNPQEPKETHQVILEPRKPDSVIVSDSVKDSVSDNVIVKEKKSNTKRTIEQFQEIARKSFENCKCVFGNDFKKEWFILIQSENWKKKDQNAYDYNLKRLMKFDEVFSIALIESAIAGSYKGVVFPNTNESYQKYLKEKNATKSRNHNDLKSERAELRAAAFEIIRNS